MQRAVIAARRMPDRDLRELHARGAASLKSGAWEILDEELKRRDVAWAPEGNAPVEVAAAPQAREPVVEDEPEPQLERYRSVGMTIVVLRGVAVAGIAGGVAAVVMKAGTMMLVGGLAAGALAWFGAELLQLLTRIEANTRRS